MEQNSMHSEVSPLLFRQESSTLAEKRHGNATEIETVLNLMKTCMGTGCLGLAFACQQGGIILYSIGLLAIGAWNTYAVQRLCACLDYIPGDSFSLSGSCPEGVVEDTPPIRSRNPRPKAPTPPPSGTSTLSVVAWHAFGPIGLEVLDAMMIILLFGIITAYVAAVVTFLSDTPFSLGRWMDATISAILFAIIAMVPDMGHLSNNSAIGLSILAFTFLVIAGYGDMSHDHQAVSHLHGWPQSLAGASQFFGICVYGYGIVPLTYNFRSSMAQPERMVPATMLAVLLVASAYIFVGIGLYILYPDLEGELLHELPHYGFLPVLTRLAMVVVVFMTVPLLVVPCGELLEGKFQTDRRGLVRFCVCGISALLATSLPSFVQVLSLVGCACVGMVGFVLPPLLHSRLLWLSQRRLGQNLCFGGHHCRFLVVDALLLTWGVIATVISTVYTLREVNAV
jgi:amino acid permease